MSDLKKAAQQALEALEGFVRFAAIHSDGPDASDKYLAEDYAEEAFLKAAKVLPDLRAALAQQEQAEPVAWRYKGMMSMPWSLSDDGYYVSRKRDKGYTVEPLFTHPPRREWVSLTEEELNMIYSQPQTHKGQYARAIEAALKERNT